MDFHLSYKCYQCSNSNTVLVEPIEIIHSNDDTIIENYADTIYTACPHCGQRYAIPNNRRRKVISSTWQNVEQQEGRDSA